MKRQRQDKLLSIIGKEAIETQENLLKRLHDEGFDVTQATISRDIKEMRLIKILTENGTYRYAASAEPVTFSSRLRNIFRESVTSMDLAQNLIVIKTLPGMAQAAASAIDAMSDPMVAGTLAGDDTAFVALRNEASAKGMVEQLRAILSE